jgi:hypothetical protein
MNRTKYFSLALVAMLMASCDQGLEEINRNPNNPEIINPELLMVTVIRGTVNQTVNDAWNTGNIVSQYAAQIREPNTDRYQWGAFGTWSNGYTVLRDVNNLYDIADARKLDNYKGIALVMRALIFSQMTDIYGDLPYTQALKGKEESPVYSPTYDTQAEIYAGLLEELEQANQLLSPAGGLISNDILYGNSSYTGDPLKWRKLANSLKLRLLVRQSNKVDPSQALQQILSNPTQYPIFQSNTDNAALVYSAAPNLFPITSTRIGFWRDRRLSKTLYNQLNTTNDPRLRVYAEPTTESVTAFNNGTGSLKWDGVRNGETDANLGSNIDSKVSTLGKTFYVDLAIPVPARGLVLTYAEVSFILAEAAQRGWISGSAEIYYTNGIKASVDYWRTISGVSITASDSFLAGAGVKFEAATALEQIGKQKWIALFFHDFQGWHEWKRTGFPNLVPSIVNFNGNRIPVRSIYPTAQQTTNRVNYEAAVARQGVDDINTKLWWQ